MLSPRGKAMDRGFVKLWRKYRDSGLLKNHKLWAFFSYCNLKATYTPHTELINGSVVHLDIGECVIGRKTVASDLGMSEQNVRTCIKNLEDLKKITSRTTNKFTVIKMLDWALEQGENDTIVNNQPSNQPAEQLTPTHSQISNQHLTSSQPILNQQIFENQPANNQQLTSCEQLIMRGLQISQLEANQQITSNQPSENFNFDGNFENHLKSNHKEEEEKEKEGFKEKREKKKSSSGKDFSGLCSEVLELWKIKCSKLPQIRKWTSDRQKHLIARIREEEERQVSKFWEDFFEQVSRSDFLNGKNRESFRANLDWLIRSESNITKVLEGNYDNVKVEKSSKFKENCLKLLQGGA
jgi:hypothetical protein